MDLPYDPIPPYVEAEPDAPPRPSSTAPTGASVRQEVAPSVVPAAHADWFAFGGPDPTEAPAGPAGGREPMAAAAPDGPHPGRTWAIGLGAVALAVLAFFGARAVSGHKAATATATSGPAAIPGGLGGRRPGTAGTIARIDGSTLTLTDSTGQSIKVVTGASTTVTSSAPARLTDIAAGDRLTVIGTASTTNAIAATTVTEMPRLCPL